METRAYFDGCQYVRLVWMKVFKDSMLAFEIKLFSAISLFVLRHHSVPTDLFFREDVDSIIFDDTF